MCILYIEWKVKNTKTKMLCQSKICFISLQKIWSQFKFNLTWLFSKNVTVSYRFYWYCWWKNSRKFAFDYIIITRFFKRKRKGHSLLGVSNSQGLHLKKNSSIARIWPRSSVLWRRCSWFLCRRNGRHKWIVWYFEAFQFCKYNNNNS